MTNFEEMLKNLCDNLETQKQAFKQDRWAQIEAGERGRNRNIYIFSSI